ncbi:MAG: hypothetical protein ACRBC3_19785 [Burkholderiaceae bacterium]
MDPQVIKAIAHIAGAIAATVSITGLAGVVDYLLLSKRAKNFEREASITLGIPLSELGTNESLTKMRGFLAERYSSELLQNRLSDFARHVQWAWLILAFVSYLAIMGFVVWQAVATDIEISVMAWVATVLWTGAILVSLTFSALCRLLTGRQPGESRYYRKTLA